MSTYVEEDILGRNPQFAKLYYHLTSTLLNSDGSTKTPPDAKERIATDKSLEKHRQRAIKHHLIEHALRTATEPPDAKAPTLSSTPSFPASRSLRPANRLQQRRTQSLSSSASSSTSAPHTTTTTSAPSSCPPDPLPEPLLDLILTLPPFLDAAHTLPHEAVALLLSNAPLSDLPTLLPDLADIVSSTLHAAALGLARLTHLSTNPTFLHRHVSALPQDLADLKDKLATAQSALSTSRLRALRVLADLLHTYGQCLTLLIRSLESKHGVVARSLELRATDISLQAQIAEKSTELKMWRLRKQLYTPEVVSALQNYMTHLKDTRIRTGERIRALTMELEERARADGGDGNGNGEEDVPRGDFTDDEQQPSRTYRDMDQLMGDLERDAERLRVTP